MSEHSSPGRDSCGPVTNCLGPHAGLMIDSCAWDSWDISSLVAQGTGSLHDPLPSQVQIYL